MSTCINAGDEQDKIARMYFGYKPNRNTKLFQGDGVQLMKNMRENKSRSLEMVFNSVCISPSDDTDSDTHDHHAIDVILIDADCKDSSLPMSAPPPEFTTKETLQCMYDLLNNEGMLIMNVVARVDTLLHETGEEIRQIFVENSGGNGYVYMMKANEETMNRAIVAVKGKTDNSQPKWKILDSWLKSVGLAYDPLELHEAIDMFEEVQKMERMEDMD